MGYAVLFGYKSKGVKIGEATTTIDCHCSHSALPLPLLMLLPTLRTSSSIIVSWENAGWGVNETVAVAALVVMIAVVIVVRCCTYLKKVRRDDGDGDG